MLQLRERWRVLHGDAGEQLDLLDPEQFDALVTDPPSGIGFMGSRWDRDRGGRVKWVEWLAGILGRARRALRPGAYGFVWALPRTSHWTGEAIEQAGFEVRDLMHDALPSSTLLAQFLGSLDEEQQLALERLLDAAEPSRLLHLFGSGFPKSKALLKPAVEHWFLVRNPGPLRPLRVDECRVGYVDDADHRLAGDPQGSRDKTTAGRWPAHLVLEHADGCRVVGNQTVRSRGHYPARRGSGSKVCGTSGHHGQDGLTERFTAGEQVTQWDCAEGCPVLALGKQSGSGWSTGGRVGNKDGGAVYSNGRRGLKGDFRAGDPGYGDHGTASRFFHQLAFEPFLYQAKASSSERERGCHDLSRKGEAGRRNHHPTVKSVKLMRHLCRLICPPGGLVLDPFAGSGSTGVGCAAEGVRFVGIEADAGFVEICRARLGHAYEGVPDLDEGAPAGRDRPGRQVGSTSRKRQTRQAQQTFPSIGTLTE